MTSFAWIGLIIIVAIAAFFVGSVWTKKQFKHSDLEQQAQQAKHELEQYRQEVADHLASTKKLMGKMQDSYSQLLSHVEETNQVLLSEKPSHPSEPFFSKETTEQLHASLKSRPERRRSDRANEGFAQPTDYVDGESGLFSGERLEVEQTKAS
ncbi:cytochrome D ubiquinol oxidase subunit III [Pseudoalteromonas sp. A25]|uniref:YhcB family protein n=1 Tax=Pseudoalteromonas sp. A25 TaxID=116092 RepID=UPI0012608665|nr:YhcB family protein [Pseudoalteromonas sp. A25]BBN80314.1 cytochrome D ubiquinol oxidase subunit III [Pseudoalteromonas sp. A25]